ncbi:MAG: DUF1934 domain-containing protein [Atopostipes suicloacalis]|nr:DUF1934 domain-containing protein [Atopostipes suicloacalis]MDN6731616.1 DUF1934 domain-containing protein [Atopostipes suicloacalis]
MSEDKLTKGQAARIILETTIVQEEKVFRNTFDEMGRIVSMNDHYYLRFVEEDDSGKIPTVIKISSEGTVTVIRHSENKTHLEFDEETDTYTNYQTPAGLMKMRVKTSRINLSYQGSPFAGEVEVDYHIYNKEIELGTYQIRLRFTT